MSDVIAKKCKHRKDFRGETPEGPKCYECGKVLKRYRPRSRTPKHGTIGEYKQHGCRCELCLAAKREDSRLARLSVYGRAQGRAWQSAPSAQTPRTPTVAR